MRPHLADVTGHGNGDTTTADRFADAVFESETVESISRCSRVDLVSEARARLPRTRNVQAELQLNSAVIPQTPQAVLARGYS